MGTPREDLPKCREVLEQIEDNIGELKKAGSHFRKKRVAYRNILKGSHSFNIESMEREIDDCGDEIEKVEKAIDEEKLRRDHWQFVIDTLEEQSGD